MASSMYTLGVFILVRFGLTVATTSSFLIVNDLHYDPTYYSSQESCVEPVVNLPKYGTFDCEPNWELVESAVKSLAAQGSPRFIIWLGDNTHHARNYADSSFKPGFVVDVITNITRLLEAYFPDIPVLPVLGNHDYFPKDQLPVQASSGGVDPTYDALGDLWAGWIGSEEQVDNFKRGGYYTRVVDEDTKLVAIVLNNNLYLPKNAATRGLEDPGGQYAWAERYLSQAREEGYRVVFVIHVPVGYDENTSNKMYLREADNDRLVQLIQNNSDIIMGVFSGHAHTDTFKVIYNEESEPVSSVFVSPALSPWRTFWNYDSRNPAFREVTYMYDNQEYTLKDITQYYLRLVNANAEPDKEAVWNTEYSFSRAYGLQSLKPQEVHNLISKMKEHGSRWFHDYYRYNTVSVTREPCSYQCKLEHICAMKAIQRRPYDQCISSGNALIASFLLPAVTYLMYHLLRP